MIEDSNIGEINDIRVAILMPAYNQAKYIREALDSLLAQTFTNWECAIVDDGSPDDVASIVKEYDDMRIRFYHTENHGVSAARNFAASVTSAPLILPLDADDKIHPQYLELCVREFIRQPDLRVAYCNWKFFGTTKYTPALLYSDYRNLLLSNSIFCSAMYRREDFDRIGGYDEEIPFGYEDWEFWIRMLAPDSEDSEQAGKVVQLPQQMFYYRIKKQSRSKDVDNQQRRKEECLNYIYKKNRAIYQKFFPDMLYLLNKYTDEHRHIQKWEKRSLPSRLWHALTGKL